MIEISIVVFPTIFVFFLIFFGQCVDIRVGCYRSQGWVFFNDGVPRFHDSETQTLMKYLAMVYLIELNGLKVPPT